ncbi:hypothetical protein PsorP6_011248 [Peronosclerospora sorghi]|uniref:Uncharacterized protein n=1 Tax=Peronosclerospora sorghi TaxID=230839 RepID=A0ACC0WKZ7_9STRA|nr:hypothetical protein PsorP6_011248 [Peronosclerospora sorghi]
MTRSPISPWTKFATRIRRAKRMVFGTIADPHTDRQPFPPSQKEYPMLTSVNSFEWLSEGMGDTTPLTKILFCGINPASLHARSAHTSN